MYTISQNTAVRLANVWLTISGILSVTGIIAINSGWLTDDHNSTSSPKQNEVRIVEHQGLSNPTLGKVNMPIFFRSEMAHLMTIPEVKNHSLQSKRDQSMEKSIAAGTSENTSTQISIRSLDLQP